MKMCTHFLLKDDVRATIAKIKLELTDITANGSEVQKGSTIAGTSLQAAEVLITLIRNWRGTLLRAFADEVFSKSSICIANG